MDFKTSGKTPDPELVAHTTEVQTTEYGLLYREATGKAEAAVEVSRRKAELDKLIGKAQQFRNFLTLSHDKYLPIVIVIGLGIVFGPAAWKCFLYFCWSPLLSFSSPTRFSATALPLIDHGNNDISPAINLKPGERLRVRPDFLLASDDRLTRRVCFWLRGFPMTSALSGLTEMIDLLNEDKDATRSVTLSNQRKPMVEFLELDIPEGGCVVMRPTFIVGFLLPDGASVRVERRWSWRIHAWITLQFLQVCRLFRRTELGWPRRRLCPGAGGFTA